MTAHEKDAKHTGKAPENDTTASAPSDSAETTCTGTPAANGPASSTGQVEHDTSAQGGGEGERADELFARSPIPEAVMKNAIPAMLAMLMVLVYNLADTFFIGQTHDALLVAAISLATPVFLMHMALGTLFGAGGVSVVSRALGAGDFERAKRANAFAVWACLAASIVFSALVLVFIDPILSVLGASADTWQPTKNYLVITSFAGPLIALCNCFSNIVRAEGAANRAMAGMLVGNLANIVLDPVFILAAGWGVAGAAVATLLGNVIAVIIYLQFYIAGRSTLGLAPRNIQVRGGIATGVLAIGTPASLASVLMNVSQIVANAQMAGYGDLYVSGLGVAMKVVMITGMVCMGLAQGIQPLLGYCVGAKLWQRFGGVMKFSLAFITATGAALAVLCYLFTPQVVGAFLTDEAASGYAVRFARILLTTSFLFGVFYVLACALQACGAATPALVVNISRQGLVYIPMLFILQPFFGADGIAWAQPAADVLSLGLAIVLYVRTYRKLRRADEQDAASQSE